MCYLGYATGQGPRGADSLPTFTPVHAWLLLHRSDNASFTSRNLSSHDYFYTNYPNYNFSGCATLGMRPVKDPAAPIHYPHCLVRASFENAPQTIDDAMSLADTSQDGWADWISANTTCRVLYLDWRDGRKIGCTTYGQLARTALNRVPVQPNVVLIGYPTASMGFNGGPYMDPYFFPDLTISDESRKRSKKSHGLQAAPPGVYTAIVPPRDAHVLSYYLFAMQPSSDNSTKITWTMDVTQQFGPWNETFQSMWYYVVLWVLFALSAGSLVYGLGRLAYHLRKRKFDWRAPQSLVFYIGVLGCAAHLGELYVVYRHIHHESSWSNLTNSLLTIAYVSLLWIWHLRFTKTGLLPFQGAWFFAIDGLVCAAFSTLKAFIVIVGTRNEATRTQSKLIVRVFLGPSQIILLIGLVMFAIRFRLGDGDRVRRRMSRDAHAAIIRITFVACMGAIGFALLAVDNTIAVNYTVLASKPHVLISYYTIRYLASTVRVIGLMVGLRLNRAPPMRPRVKSVNLMDAGAGGGLKQPPQTLGVRDASDGASSDVSSGGETFVDDWDPERTFGPSTVKM